MRGGVKGRLEFFQKFIRFGSGTLTIDKKASRLQPFFVYLFFIIFEIYAKALKPFLFVYLFFISFKCYEKQKVKKTGLRAFTYYK